MLGKNPTSVRNAITLAQKKNAELCIIEGLHNHDPEHERNGCHVGRDPMRSAHMNIQQKFLCLAAYEGFVPKTSTLNIEQYPALVFQVGSKY